MDPILTRLAECRSDALVHPAEDYRFNQLLITQVRNHLLTDPSFIFSLNKLSPQNKMASQIPDPENSALSIAINNVSHERLRSLFIAICEKVPEAREQAQTALLIETNSVGNPTEKERSRYSNCENCEKEFDTLGNTEKSCRYHPGQSATFCTLSFGKGNKADTQQRIRKLWRKDS